MNKKKRRKEFYLPDKEPINDFDEFIIWQVIKYRFQELYPTNWRDKLSKQSLYYIGKYRKQTPLYQVLDLVRRRKK